MQLYIRPDTGHLPTELTSQEEFLDLDVLTVGLQVADLQRYVAPGRARPHVKQACHRFYSPVSCQRGSFTLSVVAGVQPAFRAAVYNSIRVR